MTEEKISFKRKQTVFSLSKFIDGPQKGIRVLYATRGMAVADT
jgi:hypothetical protein